MTEALDTRRDTSRDRPLMGDDLAAMMPRLGWAAVRTPPAKSGNSPHLARCMRIRIRA